MRLTNKDLAIIAELDQNPHCTTSALAKKLHTSQQVVDYRLKKLINDNIILQFGTVFNLSKIGYAEYRVLIKLSNITDITKHAIITHLKNHPNVSWAAIVGGKWDLFLIVFVKNYDEFDHFLDKLFNTFPGALKDYDSLYTLTHEFYPHKYLHKKIPLSQPITINFSNAEGVISLDKIDHCLCHNIKSACRRSTVELGKQCNTTYKTVHNRLHKLEQQGLISGYRIILASETLGYKAVLLLVSFQSYTHDVEDKLFRFARNNLFITQALKLFGRWNLLFHIRIKEDQTLQNLIIQLRNLYPSIRDYEIIPVFEDITIDTFPISKQTTFSAHTTLRQQKTKKMR